VAQPSPPKVKIDRTDLVFLTDGKKHFIALKVEDSDQIFYARQGETFYHQLVFSASSDGSTVTRMIWAPQVYDHTEAIKHRFSSHGAELTNRGQRWSLACGTRVVPLTVVPARQAAVMRAKATFEPRYHRRKTYLFARSCPSPHPGAGRGTDA
jgi:hypothetical protein